MTGVRNEIRTDLKSIVDIIRDKTDVPCAVGFGISRPEQAAAMAAVSDGAIVGSAIIRIIAEHKKRLNADNPADSSTTGLMKSVPICTRMQFAKVLKPGHRLAH